MLCKYQLVINEYTVNYQKKIKKNCNIFATNSLTKDDYKITHNFSVIL